jgi:tetratricopeptide (TPR) repeat protein
VVWLALALQLGAACKAGEEAVARRDWAAAEPALVQCIKSPAVRLDHYLSLCGVYQAQGNGAALHSVALQGLKKFPAEKRFYLTAGTYAGRVKQFGEAIDVLEAGRKRWPEDAQLRVLLESAHVGRGMELLDQGQHEGAEKHLKRAVELDPQDIEALMNLGRAQHNLHRGIDAVSTFNRVLEQSPRTTLARFHRGLAYYALGDFDRAIEDVGSELEYPPARLTRGLALVAKGEWEKALTDLEVAAEQMPLDAKAQYGRARCLARLGRVKEAEEGFRRAIELDKDDPGPVDALRRLREGERPGKESPAVKAVPPAFEDTAARAGLTLRTVSGAPDRKPYLVESVGGGLAVIDYNNDGWMDLYLVNGATIATARAGKVPYRSALYRNNKDGTFTDVTLAAGVPNQHWGKGALAADLDNDGFQDLYVTNFGPNVLYLNNGNGTFRDATAKAGVGDARWSSAAAAADYDRDGDLDLFVVNYLDYDLSRLPTSGKFCSYQGVAVACGPRGLKGAGDTLYRNNGDGTFTDVSKAAGVGDEKGHYGLGAVWGDYDNDGDPDLFVANDSMPNLLYRNNGDGTFTDVAVEAGVAFSDDGREQAGMGVEFEDLDNDGWLDVLVTNFSDDYNTLYRNLGNGQFRDDSHTAGLVADSWRDLSWGAGFFDFNNDGWKDVFVANGHIYPEVDRMPIQVRYRQVNKLYVNVGGPRLEQVNARAGLGLQVVKSHRGAAFADFNNDGWMDIAVAALEAPPSLLMNRGGGREHWAMVKLEGVKSNRFGVGARVELRAGGQRQVREVKAGGSYASTNDMRAHFGLGEAEAIEELVVKWPSGLVTVVSGGRVDSVITVREGR